MSNYQLKALITGVDKLSPMLKQLRTKVGGLRRDLRGAADGAVAMGASVAVGIGASAKAFADAEDAAAGLEVSMMRAGGRVGPEFAKISQLATQLGNRLPGTTAEFQNMMTMLVRQGMPAENILGGVGEAAAYLAVQLKKSPEQAAEFAAKMQDATKTVSADMMGLMDVIQRTFYLGVDDDNMLSAFSSLSSAMDMMNRRGLDGSRALAPLVVMLDQASMSGEAAGNALRKVIQSGLDMKAVRKASAMAGVRLDFTDGKGEFGGIEKMFAQLAKLEGLNTVKRAAVLEALFGNNDGVNRAISTLIGKGIDGYREVQAKMEAQADLQIRVNRQLSTLKNLWDGATGTFTNMLVGFGEAISPELKQLSEGLASLSERVQGFTQRHPGVVRGLAAMAVGLAGFKLAALGGMIALKAFSAVLTMTPLGLFLRLAVMGSMALIANWSKVKEWFSGFGSWLAEKFGQLRDLLWAFATFNPLRWVIKNWEPIVAWFRRMWERLQPFLAPFSGGGAPGSGSPVMVSSIERSNMAVQRQAQQQVRGQIDVNFENAPPGMRVKPAQSASGVRFTPNVGYNRFASQS